MKNKMIIILVTIASLIVIIDQASKLWVTSFVKESCGNENFGFELTTNTGIAFGINKGNTKNIILSVFGLFIIFMFLKKQYERIDTKTMVAIALVLGGAISNLIDRIFRDGILDFIRVYKLPVFNIADVLILLGGLLLIIFLVDFTRKN